jgi:hypothetical protein
MRSTKIDGETIRLTVRWPAARSCASSCWTPSIRFKTSRPERQTHPTRFANQIFRPVGH